MRTRTNLYTGEGTEGFIKILKNFYPEGTAEVICDDVKEAENTIKALEKAEYNVIVTPTENYEGREYFAVCVGKRAFFRGRKLCKGRFCAVLTFLCPDMFCKGEKFAEFLYTDKGDFSLDKNGAEKAYALLLSSVAEGLGAFYRGKNMPYEDKGLKRLLERGKDVLLGRADKDEFIKDCFALAKEIAERTDVFSDALFTVTTMAETSGGREGNYAECACFLIRTLILFTKWNFRDMLITVEKPVAGIASDRFPAYGEADLIIDDGDLKKIFGFVNGFRSRIGLRRLIDIFEKSVSSADAAFAEIYNRGIYEGIKEYG